MAKDTLFNFNDFTLTLQRNGRRSTIGGRFGGIAQSEVEVRIGEFGTVHYGRFIGQIDAVASENKPPQNASHLHAFDEVPTN